MTLADLYPKGWGASSPIDRAVAVASRIATAAACDLHALLYRIHQCGGYPGQVLLTSPWFDHLSLSTDFAAGAMFDYFGESMYRIRPSLVRAELTARAAPDGPLFEGACEDYRPEDAIAGAYLRALEGAGLPTHEPEVRLPTNVEHAVKRLARERPPMRGARLLAAEVWDFTYPGRRVVRSWCGPAATAPDGQVLGRAVLLLHFNRHVPGGAAAAWGAWLRRAALCGDWSVVVRGPGASALDHAAVAERLRAVGD